MNTSPDPSLPQTSVKPNSVNPGLIIVLMVLVGLMAMQMLSDRGLFSEPIEDRTITPRGDLADDEKTTIELFDNAKDSTVLILTLAARLHEIKGLGWVWGENVPEGVGSGIVWDDRGHIVTNMHVIEHASAATIVLSDGSKWDARAVAIDPTRDLAVLKIDAPPGRLKPVPLGSSDDLKVGQNVFALGFPWGLDLTLTRGIISGRASKLTLQNGAEVKNAIQTDASINPGNSGGPMLDSAGRLIGMNTAIYASNRGSSGVGFAIPVDTIRASVGRLLKYSPVVDEHLGIEFWPEISRWSDPDGNSHAASGIEIIYVAAEGVADKAGIRGVYQDPSGKYHRGDLIVAVDGKDVTDAKSFVARLKALSAGDKITLDILREGHIGQVELTVR